MTNVSMHTILVLGGTSSIALAIVHKRLISLGEAHVILVGRNTERLEAECADLKARGAKAEIVSSNLSTLAAAEQLGDGFIDEVVLAYGTLGDQSKAQTDADYLGEQLRTNFTSAVQWLEWCAQRFMDQGHGSAVVIGSVAGDRGRQSNYVYGAAKAGLETFTEGLQHRFADNKNIYFLIVKPGFVDSPMTAHIQNKGALWATTAQVAIGIEKAVLRKQRVVYVPWFWGLIMLIIRNIPAIIFHKTKL